MSMSTHPTWTEHERQHAAVLHAAHCGCPRPATWGWLKLARAQLNLMAAADGLAAHHAATAPEETL